MDVGRHLPTSIRHPPVERLAEIFVSLRAARKILCVLMELCTRFTFVGCIEPIWACVCSQINCSWKWGREKGGRRTGGFLRQYLRNITPRRSDTYSRNEHSLRRRRMRRVRKRRAALSFLTGRSFLREFRADVE